MLVAELKTHAGIRWLWCVTSTHISIFWDVIWSKKCLRGDTLSFILNWKTHYKIMVLNLIPKMINTHKKNLRFQQLGGEKKKTCRQFQGGETADSQLSYSSSLPHEENTSKTRGGLKVFCGYIHIYLIEPTGKLESEHVWAFFSKKNGRWSSQWYVIWNNGWLWNVWPLGTPRIYDSSFASSRSVLVTLHLLVHIPTLWDLHT